MRALISWLLALAGLAATAYGTFHPWYEDRLGSTLPLSDLFSGVQRDTAPVISSMLVPLALGALLALVGMFRAKGLMQLGGILLVVSTGVWVIRSQDVIDTSELQIGLWNALFGSLLVLAASIMRPGRL
ncbi:hypothetical protein V5P93_000828 [Actinokineospora auranticolor]|uniref:DoxX family protein n=1 Tax=Actinokineospora auranticolor TaxID=155976 RepID=A0A2S6GYI1_9PSEU|nr:hypothetical protein [Actinokineospora auranticolor]PPK70295.1 hypothetical protein CLV40_102206 [Actinokineospora auranticolor]